MILRRTLQELIDLTARTPYGEPVGLTQYEINVVEKAVTHTVTEGDVLMGRRIVRLPWDWSRDLDDWAGLNVAQYPRPGVA